MSLPAQMRSIFCDDTVYSYSARMQSNKRHVLYLHDTDSTLTLFRVLKVFKTVCR
jgi:hypothetical protein